jgi:iron complex transport system permease protein
VLAALVGAALAGAGAAFQAVLRNPLADPFILGISGGAALGASLSAALGAGSFLAAAWSRPLAAFAGATATVVLLFAMARHRGRTGTTTLLLVGVILNAFTSALILFIATAGSPARFQEIMQTLVGQMGTPSWPAVAIAGGLIACGLGALLLAVPTLNVLALGDEEAGHLGLEVERATWTVVVAASLATAAGVAFTGIIGFVGLIVPHVVRTFAGADHRAVLPGSILAGASFLMLADAAARTALAPTELPVGVVTALLGGPFFLVLLLKRLREDS